MNQNRVESKLTGRLASRLFAVILALLTLKDVTMKPQRACVLIVAMALGISSVAMAQSIEPVQPISIAKAGNPAKIELGKKLFFEPRLSK